MDEEDPIFDPSLKKKKKKKKMPVELEAALTGETPAEEPAAAAESTEADPTDEAAPATASIDDIGLGDDFSLTKKKKKKKKPFDMNELEDALPKEDKLEETEEIKDATQDFGDEDLDFSLPSKKKKKKKPKLLEETEKADDNEEGGEEEGSKKNVEGTAWSDTDRDYTYDELLKRVFNIMREKNPDMVAGEKKRFVMKPPQVMRVGTKKSSFSNFADICKLLHRQPKHLLAFLLAELGTSGSIDGNNQLIIKGRFQQKQIEHVLRAYIKEYVTCHTCRSPETILQKDTRLYFLQCETCGSRCSVASIKSGFQAVTGKRAALRAKTT